ncbi:XdhC family protein [Paraburkholderia sp. DHOC27]|uniref:XdhC family protein n=1 Tax=Paraburkholderia sp. DHOC27 TaxID=2303330 RepID=UPI000E3E5588|nr:XdhC family protein [Paraburkholderia sp. DHOC27]RFU44575.1 YHS domain-containing protein [Paraburkholderia sp. DHOC27]
MNAATLLELEQRLTDEAQPFAVATVIRAAPPTSAWVGAQALIDGAGELYGWIGGGCSRAIVIQAAQEAIRLGQPKRVRISNDEQEPEADLEAHAMPCASNGTLELFIQPTVPAPTVLVLGSTPTALEACVLAQRVGFRVCAAAQVSSACGSFTPFASLGLQRVVHGFDADAFASLAPQLILIATQGEGDEDALEAALRSGAAAVLLVASQKKAERLRESMLLRGVTLDQLSVLHAPAGPAIHAQTPQEIALGAVAGLVTLRRELQQRASAGEPAGGSHGEAVAALPPCESMASVELPVAATARAASYRNPVCGMAVDIATARHVVEADGQRVYFCCDGCKIEFEREPKKYLAKRDRHEEPL